MLAIANRDKLFGHFEHFLLDVNRPFGRWRKIVIHTLTNAQLKTIPRIITGVDLSKILGCQTKILVVVGQKVVKVIMHGRFSILGGTCPGCLSKSTPMRN